MALTQSRLIAPVWQRLRTKVGIRFTRFAGVAILALATSETALALCNGVLHMTATPAALVSNFAGAVVSYVLSRWAWERKGKPDVLRETVPFYVITAIVWVILLLATKLGYHIAAWMNLHGIKNVLLVGFVYLVANFFTFLVRFVIFHYVLFAERATAARAAATGPDAVPPGTRRTPRPAEAPHSAAPAVTAEAANGGEVASTGGHDKRESARAASIGKRESVRGAPSATPPAAEE